MRSNRSLSREESAALEKAGKFEVSPFDAFGQISELSRQMQRCEHRMTSQEYTHLKTAVRKMFEAIWRDMIDKSTSN